MKRLIAALILTIFVLFSYIFSLNYILDCCDTTNNMVKEAIASYNSTNSTYEKTKEIKKYWQEKEKVLSFFLNHETIDEVELAIASINIYAKVNNSALFYENADKIKVYLHQIIDDTKITTHSIF